MGKNKQSINIVNQGKKLINYIKSQSFLRLLVCAFTTVLVCTLFMTSIIPVRYDLKVGQVPTVTIAANKDVVDEYTTEKMRNEVAAKVMPTYKFQEGITQEVMANYDKIFAELRAVRQYADTLPDNSHTRIYAQEEIDYAKNMLTLLTLQDYQIKTLLRTSQEELEGLYAPLYNAIENVLNGHVTQGQEYEAAQNSSMIVGFSTSTMVLQNIVMPLTTQCMKANRIIDQEATEKAKEEVRATVEPVIYQKGQNIVVKGEGRIGLGQLNMLEDLGLLYTSNTDVLIYVGAGAYVALVMLIMYMILLAIDPKTMHNMRYLLLLNIIFVVSFTFCIVARFINVYMAPIALCAMLMVSMLSFKTGIICNVVITVLLSTLATGASLNYTHGVIDVFSMGITSGALAGLIIRKGSNRVQSLITGAVVSAINYLVLLFFDMMTSSTFSLFPNETLWCIGSGILSGLLCISVQPLLELSFNLPTTNKLLELSNPNSPLLRKLMFEAPGTYHHSILVANLAEASAEKIGANPLLTRVGAYYHDIGKLKRPLYFKENQVGDYNVHDHTDPLVSANILTSHTVDGVIMAKAHRLPLEIQQIIAQHHGNTPVMYFYHKALQQSNGKPVDIQQFRYAGERPTTKESALILICDTIEAAVRSQKDLRTPEEMENFIVKLIRGKLADGQLNNAPLTLKDIDGICSACCMVLKGVYHERIQYPDMPTSSIPPATSKEKQDEKKKTAPLTKVKLEEEKEPPKDEKSPSPMTGEDMSSLVVSIPVSQRAVPIDELITLEPLTKLDVSQIEPSNASGTYLPQNMSPAEVDGTPFFEENIKELQDKKDKNTEEILSNKETQNKETQNKETHKTETPKMEENQDSRTIEKAEEDKKVDSNNNQ